MSGKPPSVWGPLVWDWLHSLASRWDNLGANNGEVAVKLFGALRYVLPCKRCRDSYSMYFKNTKKTLKSFAEQSKLQYWVYSLHDFVNVKLGKKSPSMHSVLSKYAKPLLGKKDPMWIALFAIALNYNENHVVNKSEKHRLFLWSIVDMYINLKDYNVSSSFAGVINDFKGRKVSTDLLVYLIKKSYLFTPK